MKVQSNNRDGRLNVFDTDSRTQSQPFGGGCMLADYEARFGQLEKGLWLQTHFYETDQRFKEDLDDSVVPVGRRAMGWRLLLAEAGELEEVEQVPWTASTFWSALAAAWSMPCGSTAHRRCSSPMAEGRPWRASCRAWWIRSGIGRCDGRRDGCQARRRLMGDVDAGQGAAVIAAGRS